MRIHPFFSYYGGKFKIAPKYPKPSGKKIIEPFAGAAGYSTRYHGRDILLNEINPIIYGIWDYLIHVKESEFLRLPIVQDIEEAGNICEEAKNLIGFWLNTASPSPRTKMSTWGKSKVCPGSHWGLEVRNRIAHQLKYIRHWKIRLGSYEDIPNEKATWFVDPPYQGEPGRLYTFHKIDYASLAEWCKERKGSVIVCEDISADWLPFRPFLNTKNQKKVKSKTEAIYYQRD